MDDDGVARGRLVKFIRNHDGNFGMTDDFWRSAASSGGFLPREYIKQKYRLDLPARINFNINLEPDGKNYEVAIVEFDSIIEINLVRGLPDIYYPERIFPIIHISRYISQNYRGVGPWTCKFHLGDLGADPDAVSFCSNVRDVLLIPDDSFCASRGYRQYARAFTAARRWEDRIDRAYFRGTDSGVGRYTVEERCERAPRVALSLLSRLHPDYLDIGLTNVEGGRDDAEISLETYRRLGILLPRDPQERILDFKYQVDIDGNTNSWNALFLKLLSRSPVLKVDSEFGFRQWYYDRLKPWENFVPIGTRFESILGIIDRLRTTPKLARDIGRAGRDLATSLTFEGEIAATATGIYNRFARPVPK